MIARIKPIAWVVLAVMIQITAIPTAHGKDIIQMLFHMSRPPGESDPSVEYLAEQIDWLEKHVDSYGTVVAKIPDVWGQARLTKHRQEYEDQMYQQLNKFDIYLQGAVSQSDQAFLANALTLQAAAASPAPKPSAKTRFFNASRTGTSLNLQMASSTPVASSAPSAASTSKPGTPDAATLLADPDKFFTTAQPINLGNFGQGANKIGVEPTIALDQRATYLDHLHEIRRRNEGDDTADSPGYGLYLVRIPISVMPGKRTFHGYAAEITLTARPHLSPSLLKETFRNLVINDVVDQLALPITRMADYILSKPPSAETEQIRQLNMQIAFLRGQVEVWEQVTSNQQLAEMQKDPRAAENAYKATLPPLDIASPPEPHLDSWTGEPELTNRVWKQFRTMKAGDGDFMKVDASILKQERQSEAAKAQMEAAKGQIQSLSSQILQLAPQAPEKAAAMQGPASRMREARNAIPPTQIADVYGTAELYYIAKTFNDSYQGPNVVWNEDPKNKHVMYLDVQGFLQDEVQAAYELLRGSDESYRLWIDPGFKLDDLAKAIRVGQFHKVCQMRENFYSRIQHTPGHMLINRTPRVDASGDDCDEQVVKALAWAILVESALLNAHLTSDMKNVAVTKCVPCAPPEGTAFYMPEPDETAVMLFNEYVAARWPIHVFAMDPYIQEQNIANDFQRRRELQIALSLGFAQGQISANDMMNYARKVETEIQTVQLNKTIVAFSHGDDTFGWRFYPRLQPPPIKGNLQTFADTLFGPSSKCDLLEQKLEPGMRECAALVIMPSFVPYITVETRSNWLRLNAHSGWLPTRHKRETSMVDTMKLSRAVRSMHEMSAHLCDSQVYRACDLRLMMNRIDQLDRLLPMQDMIVQVPIENSLGGFQMFNNGVTDLAPELHGWYGAPGVMLWKMKPDPACQGCSSCAAASQSTKGGGSGAPSNSSTMGQDGQSSGQQNPPAANSPGGGTANQGQKSSQTTPTSLADDATKLAGTTVKLATDVVNLTSASLTTITNAAAKQTKSPSNVPMPPDCDCSGTTVFLVGNHFSTVDTKVIAGGICIPRDAVTLLSRQVMQVTIPWNVNTVTIDHIPWVDVHVATPYGVTGHLHIPVYHGDATPPNNSPTLADVATAVSPLEVRLNPPTQQLVVKFKHNGDFTLDGLANVPPAKIAVTCVDQAVCDTITKKYDTVLAVVNYDSKRSPTVTLAKGANESTKWPLEMNAENLWKAIIDKGVFDRHADVFAALQTQYLADPTNISLKVDLYLRGPNAPDLHVIGPLLLKFVDEKEKGAPAGGTMLLPPPRRDQAWAAAADEFEHRYQPQGQVESGIRLMPAQPAGPPASAPTQMNPSPRRLPPPNQRGYLRQTPQATTADRQTPRHPSADARALPPYGPGNVPARR